MSGEARQRLESRNPARLGYLLLGFGCTSIAFINLFLPLMPSTIFLIVATWAFSKSSPRMEMWLLEHPWFGHSLRTWRDHRAIPRKAKRAAISAIWICLAGSGAFLVWKGLAIWTPLLLLVGISLTWYLASRPSEIDGVPA